MKLPKSLTTVTTISKLFALWLYIFLPFAGFYLGMQYQQMRSTVEETTSPAQTYVSPPFLPMTTKDDELTIEEAKKIQPISPTETKVLCTQEAKMCPDGSSVSRTGPNCAFAPCKPMTP